MRRLGFTLALAMAVAMTACGGAEDSPAGPAAATPAPTPTPEAPRPVANPVAVMLDGGGSYEVTMEGIGERAVAEGDTPRFRLAITTPAGDPVWTGMFSFEVGTGQGLAVLDDAVRGMRPGEGRRVLMPEARLRSETGFGLPAGTDLVATLTLEDFETEPSAP